MLSSVSSLTYVIKQNKDCKILYLLTFFPLNSRKNTPWIISSCIWTLFMFMKKLNVHEKVVHETTSWTAFSEWDRTYAGTQIFYKLCKWHISGIHVDTHGKLGQISVWLTGFWNSISDTCAQKNYSTTELKFSCFPPLGCS